MAHIGEALHVRIIDVLRKQPKGMTTRELMEHIPRAREEVSSLASKMAAYGCLNKRRETRHRRSVMVWSMKP